MCTQHKDSVLLRIRLRTSDLDDLCSHMYMYFLSSLNTCTVYFTLQVCLAFNKKYSYIGVAASPKCFCDDALPGGVGHDEADCTVPCPDDNTQMCGDTDKYSVYSVYPIAAGKFRYASDSEIWVVFGRSSILVWQAKCQIDRFCLLYLMSCCDNYFLFFTQ